MLEERYEKLSRIEDYWAEVGFEPWRGLGLTGVYRRVTFRKGALLGEVARYYADDYIIWEHEGERSVERILREWKGLPEVMAHRVLLLGDETWPKHLQKSFRWGFRGWVEIYSLRLGDNPHKRFADLAYWTLMGLDFASKISGGGTGLEVVPATGGEAGSLR
ncbi:MAG: hypothetical protein GX449_00735 [Synergistaceae bacterium]|nr:hypothetical protein [Synergistaceae bacterium]